MLEWKAFDQRFLPRPWGETFVAPGNMTLFTTQRELVPHVTAIRGQGYLLSSTRIAVGCFISRLVITSASVVAFEKLVFPRTRLTKSAFGK